MALRRSALLGVLLCVSARPAGAQYATFDLERLELNPSGLGSLVVGSGELLPGSSFRSSVVAHYQHDPIILREPGGARLGEVVHERLTLHLTRQYSLNQRIEFALQLPIIVYQSGDDLTAHGPARASSGGLGSPNLSARLALLRTVDGAPLDLAVQAATALPFGSAGAFARDNGLNFAPRLMASRRLFGLMGNVELGALLRPPAQFADSRVHNHLFAGAALSTFGSELTGEIGLRGAWFFQKIAKSLEVVGGPRYTLNEQVELFGLAGLPLWKTIGMPEFRVLMGVSFLEGKKDFTPKIASPPPDEPPTKPAPPQIVQFCVQGKPHEPATCPDLDLDEDGVKNGADKCASAAEDKDGFVDDDGCPDPDNDLDGVPDVADKCPTEKGELAYSGCALPDLDRDGILDPQDRCPNEAGPADREGCPLKDTDKDGIQDEKDGCPTEAGPLEARGCPAKDTDGDQVEDHLDNCPKEAGAKVNQGCPAAQKQLVVITRTKLRILDKIYFALNKATLLPRSYPLLNQVAKLLNEHPEIQKVVVEGHTDNRGNPLRNLRLSQDRAEAVRQFLVKAGVDAERLSAKGYGPSRPAFPNMSPAGREKNRRVEFTIPEE